MTIGKIIDKILDAVSNDAIRKPYAWAVYQTWKWVDAREGKGRKK